MQRSILQLDAFGCCGSSKAYRTTFRNQHGRTLFLSLELNGTQCTITDCFYTDRSRGTVSATPTLARPKRLVTLNFPTAQLLSVIESELDKLFFGVKFCDNSTHGLSLAEYLNQLELSHKYRFLIMAGSGNIINDLPENLRTRLKNRLHRSIYLELCKYNDELGVVKQCHYYDRIYARQDIKIAPPMLVSCFFPFTREGIITLVNNEICCNFTHIIVTNGTEGIDLDDPTPLCGSI